MQKKNPGNPKNPGKSEKSGKIRKILDNIGLHRVTKYLQNITTFATNGVQVTKLMIFDSKIRKILKNPEKSGKTGFPVRIRIQK